MTLSQFLLTYALARIMRCTLNMFSLPESSVKLSVEEFLHQLDVLSKDCTFMAVTAAEYFDFVLFGGDLSKVH